jgi:hypothetical protein
MGDINHGTDGYYEQWLLDSIREEQEKSGLPDEEVKDV